jgi:hypothetical protein
VQSEKGGDLNFPRKLLSKKARAGRKYPTGLEKNGHNWPTQIMFRSGIEPSTLRHNVASFGAKGLNQPSQLLTNHYLFTNNDTF